MRVLKVPADARAYYLTYLEFLSPLSKLAPQERKVLGELMYVTYLYKRIPEDIRKSILHYDNKRDIASRLNMSMPEFYNTVSQLRKKEALLGDKVNPIYMFDYDKDKQIVIEFTER